MSGGWPLGLETSNGFDCGTDAVNVRGTQVVIGAHSYPATPTQLIAATARDASWACVNIWSNGSVNTGNQQSVKLYTSSSGFPLVNDLTVINPSSNVGLNTYSFPLSIKAGSSIYAAAAGANVNDQVFVQTILFDSAFTQIEGSSGIDSIGFNVSNISGAVVSSGSTAGTKGNWTTLGTTSRSYIGLMFSVIGQTDLTSHPILNTLWDIAVGPTGSPNIIIPNLPMTDETMQQHQSAFPFFIPIRAGETLLARVADSTVNVGVYSVVTYGIIL